MLTWCLAHPATDWGIAWLGLFLFNSVTREGGAVDAWTSQKAPRLHGLVIFLRGVGGYGPMAARGLYKILSGGAAPPAWEQAILPLPPTSQGPPP